MKTVIFYSSTYNGNTLKIAESIAATLSADLIAIETKISDFDLSQYDLIGIGSAIHFGQHAIRLQRFVSALPLQGKNIFIFSTRCRPFLGNYHRTLKNIIKQKKANLVDEFSCVGFDRTGPWVLINGYNKNRPNTNDLFKARLFAEKLQCKLHPLSSVITSSTATESKQGIVLFQKEQNKIANNKVVFLNISSCIQCSKCINICPMNVFQKKDAILPIHGENCIQCQLCPMSRKERISMIRDSMDLYYHRHGGIHLVVLDGIADLIRSANDEAESIAIVDEVYRLAGIYKTCIICVLHFVPNGIKLRGHIGSELQRKAAAILSIEKDENPVYSVVKAIKVRDGSPLDVPMLLFTWDKQKDMHVSAGEKPAEDKEKRKKEELQGIIKEIFRSRKKITYTELVTELMQAMDIKERTAKSYISYMKTNGMLNQDSSNNYQP